jgi:AraC-like DNA-binding protein
MVRYLILAATEATFSSVKAKICWLFKSHLYKPEMIRSLVHVTKLFLSELPLGARVATADLRHKENIYKIFLHLADMNFRRERQMRFYADKLNISTTYLSRVVKEISGDTVNDHLTRRVFHEACNQLKASDRTMGEIARSLGFKDQSAFTNFFKLHAGCTPKAYRHR